MDFNGDFSYSDEVYVFFEADGSVSSIYPNPSNGRLLYLDLNDISSTQLIVKLFNESGALVLTKEYNLQENQDHVRFNVFQKQQINPGFYVLRINAGNLLIQEKVIVK